METIYETAASGDELILVIDQGTTSTRAMLFDSSMRAIAVSRKEIEQIYRAPGWVEQDANEIWYSVLTTVSELLEQNEIEPKQIAALGIANQRETAVLWDRTTGLAAARAIVWQSRQTAEVCDQLKERGLEEPIHRKTGLLIDPYFSATKFAWLLDHTREGRRRAEAGTLLCGTIDSWLLWKLTNGKVHATDVSNASRTQLFHLQDRKWDPELAEIFNVPIKLLPGVLPTAGHFGTTDPDVFFGLEIPITGVAGDQQAALFGQHCIHPGDVKNTYGTGSFLLMHTGDTPVFSKHGLLSTVAWEIGGEITYALEGSVFVAGSAVQWLRDSLGLIVSAQDSERLAGQVPDSGGVVLVPAFVGLGAPYWDDRVRGALFGITRGTTSAHLARAVLESIALQSADVLACMVEESGIPVHSLHADGGGSENDLLMQMQADYSNVRVFRGETEATAKGAAQFAAIGAGRADVDTAFSPAAERDVFQPVMEESTRTRTMQRWHNAVQAARSFVQLPL